MSRRSLGGSPSRTLDPNSRGKTKVRLEEVTSVKCCRQTEKTEVEGTSQIRRFGRGLCMCHPGGIYTPISYSLFPLSNPFPSLRTPPYA